MKDIILKAENISKQYRLGQVGTGTLKDDLNRWWHRIRGKEDPYLKIGETNDRSTKGTSDYVWALQDINFELERGEILGIIGKNGAGKSTLLKILSRVTSPSTGSVKFGGRVASLLEVGTGFNGEMTGRENIYLNGAILGMTKKETTSKLGEIIKFSGCERYIDTPVKRYSSGMYVRLAFAVAAFLEPEILIVDEVLAVGDAEFQKKAIGKMQDISKGEGRTVLFVSHNMAAVKGLCQKGILLENGTISYIGPINKVIEKYQNQDLVISEMYIDNYYVKYIEIRQVESEIKIICQYSNCKHLKHPFLGFVISDNSENRIFGTNQAFQPPIKEFENSDSGIISVVINNPKLTNGIYKLSIWFGDGKIDYYHEHNLISFEVFNMYDDLLKSDAIDNGYIIPEVLWSQEKIS